MSRNANPWTPWAPVFIWLAVIATESSRVGGSENTASLLRRLWTVFAALPDQLTFYTINHDIRKTLHVIGYGFLSLLIFRAVRAGWRNRQELLSGTRASLWQMRWSVLAVAGTLVVAAADEIHQTFIPGRTGTWHDVVLDTCGAILTQLLVYFWLTPRRSGPQTQEAKA